MPRNSYWIEIVTLNNIIVYRLLVLDNIWKRTTMWKFFTLDKNTLYHITVRKQMIMNEKNKSVVHRKYNYDYN